MIIDSDSYQASGIETLFFPGGEPHAKLPIFKERVILFLKARTWDDVGIGACVWDALQRQAQSLATRSVETIEEPRPVLFMPYSPGARQDRTDGTAPLTKVLIANMFPNTNNLHVFDLHSFLPTYNWRPRNWMPTDLIVPVKPDVVGIIAPDKGANERAMRFRDHFYPKLPVYHCTKERDSDTGRLSHYSMPALHKEGRHIVVDDICDGGGTFNLLAEAYRRQTRGPLELFVSHGIFSKGLTDLRRYYSHFYTTDSFYTSQYQDQPDVTVLPLRPLLEKLDA